LIADRRPSSFDLDGRVAVITGGSRGMGKAICHEFARHGADVVVASRKADACEQVADVIAAEYGVRSIGIGCHVGDWADCGRLVENVRSEFGRVDILVNNAGMSPLYDSLTSVSEELFDKVLAVNLRGPFRLSVLVGELMAAGDGGSIINVSSVAATQPGSHDLPYSVAKAGLNTLTVGLAHALGPKVRVNAIMPGMFMTDISKAWDLEEFERETRFQIPLQRGGEPHEMVAAALYFASDASSYTSGAVLKIDGGLTWSPA
jgi:NAD(P)-dependent dehydrogenase (short-subunit alcohol dehydrogenase family)